MSELKAFRALNIDTDETGMAYPQVAVDEIIAELKSTISELKATNDDIMKRNAKIVSYDYERAAELWKKKDWSHVVDILVHRNMLLSRIFFHNRTKTIILNYDKMTDEHLARDDRERRKRCLAMADRCRERFHHYVVLVCFSQNKDAMPFYRRRRDRAYKWMYKWREIANKLKEGV